MDIIQNKIFLNNKQDLQIIENLIIPLTTLLYKNIIEMLMNNFLLILTQC